MSPNGTNATSYDVRLPPLLEHDRTSDHTGNSMSADNRPSGPSVQPSADSAPQHFPTYVRQGLKMHTAPFGDPLSEKSSLPQPTQSVSWVLTADTRHAVQKRLATAECTTDLIKMARCFVLDSSPRRLT